MADDLQRIIRLDVNATQALAELEKLRKATQSVDKSVGGMSSTLTSSVDAIKNTVGVLAGAFAAFKGVKAITEAGDQIRNLEGSFTALLGSAARAKDMLQEVYAVSLATGGKLTDVASATQRLTVALADAGASNALIAQLSENFIKLGRIGGASMDETSRALVQFSQALASGKLGGDELKSILEGMPLLAKQIAKEMGVSVGALKELGSQGKITGDILVNALLNPSKEIGEQFEKLPLTLEQAWNNVGTIGTQLLANIDNISGISKTIATVFAFIADFLASINNDLTTANEQTSGWTIAVEAVGNAFRGVVIVVNALVGAIAAVLVSVKGLATAQVQLLDPREWKNLGKTFSDTVTSVKGIRDATLELNKNIALGVAPIKAATNAHRDFAENQKKVAQALLESANASKKAGKAAKEAKPPELDDWDKWLKSLEESTAKMALMPIQLQFLNAELERMAAAGDTTSARFITLKKAADDLATALDPVAAALIKITKASEDQANTPKILAGIEERMVALAAAGKMVTLEYKAMADERGKLLEQMDPTGATKLVNSLIEADAALQNLQVKFDAITAALDKGFITQATADKAKNSLLGISDATDKVIEKTKSLSDSVSEMGAKFVTDFSDKIIDSLGEVGTSFSDLIETMLKQVAKLILNSYFQQFIKALETSGNGSLSAGLGNLFAAKGAAFVNGVQYMAKGGIVTQPTMFAHGGGLGVMGEAGSEAIVPLQRNAQGDLGVAAAPVNVQVNNYTDATVSTSSRDNVDGSKLITMEIRRQVRSALTDGSMDRTMRSSYGLSRQPVIG